MIDPLLVIQLQKWYNGLYRGEKYLVLIGLALILLTIILWVTK